MAGNGLKHRLRELEAQGEKSSFGGFAVVTVDEGQTVDDAKAAWIEENGHPYLPDIWECYVEGPHSSADPGSWRTELNRPLKI